MSPQSKLCIAPCLITEMENVFKCRLHRCEHGNCRAEGKASLGHPDCPPAAQGSSKIRYLYWQFAQRMEENLNQFLDLDNPNLVVFVRSRHLSDF
jgi:hypothetical protein